MSERRVCKIVEVDRSKIRYEKKATNDSRVLHRMKKLLIERPRFGCPRVHLVLKSEGLVQNHKRTERIYYGNGLQLKKRKSKRRIYKPENPLPLLVKANSRLKLPGFRGAI